MLAPSNMQHPTEYELQIDDIKKLRDADLIICGGYEIMMQRIRTGLQIDTEKILQIKTDYNEDHINEAIRDSIIGGSVRILLAVPWHDLIPPQFVYRQLRR